MIGELWSFKRTMESYIISIPLSKLRGTLSCPEGPICVTFYIWRDLEVNDLTYKKRGSYFHNQDNSIIMYEEIRDGMDRLLCYILTAPHNEIYFFYDPINLLK